MCKFKTFCFCAFILILLILPNVASADSGGLSAETQNKIFIASALILVGVIATGIILGVSDKAVFYLNGKDLALTFIPVAGIGVLGAGALLVRSGNDPIPEWYWVLASIIEAGLIAWIYYRSFQMNQRSIFIAITTGTAKIVLSFFAVLQFMGLFSYDKNRSASQSRAVRANSALWLAIVSALMMKLVNGDRVLEPRNAYHEE